MSMFMMVDPEMNYMTFQEFSAMDVDDDLFETFEDLIETYGFSKTERFKHYRCNSQSLVWRFWVLLYKRRLQITGNPYDNAMAENFFSILKTECIYRTKLKTYDDARILISEYMHFYNNERIQLKTKLTPLEKRSQYVA